MKSQMNHIVFFASCLVCAMALRTAPVIRNTRVHSGFRNPNMNSHRLHANSVFKELMDDSSTSNMEDIKKKFDMPVPEMDFSVKHIAETFIENSEHVLMLEANTTAKGPIDLKGFKVPTAIPAIEEEFSQEEEVLEQLVEF